MSFASDIKKEITNSQIRSSCCRRALLHGVLSSKAVVSEDTVRLSLESKETVEFIKPLVKEFYGRDVESEISANGGRRHTVNFKSAKCAGFLAEQSLGDVVPFAEKCPGCRGAFLKGVFLSSGRISDPRKQYCLEFSIEFRTKIMSSVFDSLGLSFAVRERKAEKIFYTKNSTKIEDFFALAEIHSAAFQIINAKIEKDFSNNANRARNLDTFNIKKSVEVGSGQAEILMELQRRGLLNQLPEDLLKTAKLRLDFPEMSLAQLAIKSIPPLTKSGIVHRMQKIMKMAKELLNN